MSDADIKIMEEVISEVALEQETSNPIASPEENNESNEFVEKPGRLKRDKTLRWTGTRKAPALMREFTRKYKTMSPDVYSSTEELEVLEKTNRKKVGVAILQQSTSDLAL